MLQKGNPLKVLDHKVVVITGGTGSLGKVLTRRLLTGEMGVPEKIIVFSRDEAKQHAMRMEYEQRVRMNHPEIYQAFKHLVDFRIGDIRDYHAVCAVLKYGDVVVNAAALKQVPICEYFPFEAVQTNIMGPENIIRAIRENKLPIQRVIGVSTDKACKPVNVMGMSKAIQERVFIAANVQLRSTHFVCVRYGNVLASRGSVIPLFHEQIRHGGPITVTTPEMTRFLLPLEGAVDTVFEALSVASPGEIVIPRINSARVTDIATALMEDRKIEITYTGIRPGEKTHEILVSEEEALRTFERGDYYTIKPMLPEMVQPDSGEPLKKEFSSEHSLMSMEETKKLLRQYGLMLGLGLNEETEILR